MMERRMTRSDRPSEALGLLLEAARKRLGVRTITVARADGQLLASAGDQAENVAALGASIDSGRRPAGLTARVATWRMRAGGEPLVITSLGQAFSPELGEGVRRILGSVRSPAAASEPRP
jgi:hypothetical protein